MGTTGKHVAERYAQDYAETGSRLAELRLQEMKIDPAKILAQKGQLTKDDLEKAVYHFVDQRAMLQNPGMRSYYSQKNWFTRMSTMLHSYVLRQSKLFAHEYTLAWKSGNIGQIIKTHAMLGAVFPAIGGITEILADYGRGEDGWGRFEQNLSDLKNFPEHPGKALEAYIDFMSGVAAWGVATSYMRGLLRQRLSEAFTGPIGNVTSSDLQDVATVGKQALEGRKINPKPLERDALEQGIPLNIGKILAHKFIPTPAEEKARGGGKLNFRRKSGFKGLKHLN